VRGIQTTWIIAALMLAAGAHLVGCKNSRGDGSPAPRPARATTRPLTDPYGNAPDSGRFHTGTPDRQPANDF